MNTKIFLAATSHVKSAVVPYYKPRFILESFMDLRSKTKATLEYVKWCLSADEFLLDSGAFTFMNKAKRSVNFTGDMLKNYIDDYIEFINTHDIKYFFEMDLDCILGYDKVKEIRHYIEHKTNKKVIPVWHITRGIDEFHEMCKEYDYVAIGGIAVKEIKRSEHHLLFDLCDVAHSYGCRVHGLGYLPLTVLNDRSCPFDTVDGTSWQGHIHGLYFALNDGKLERIKDTRHWRILDHDSYNAWVEFSKLPDVCQEG